MGLTLRTNFGNTEAVISDSGTLRLFYKVAAVINDDLKLKFTHKEDEFDSINWEFRYKGHQLTLHYNIYNGISVFPTQARDAMHKDNKAVVELASLIAGRMPNEENRLTA